MAERNDFITGDDCLAILEAIEQDLLEEDAEFSFHITKEVTEVSKTLKATFIDILNGKHLPLTLAWAWRWAYSPRHKPVSYKKPIYLQNKPETLTLHQLCLRDKSLVSLPMRNGKLLCNSSDLMNRKLTFCSLA